MSEVTFEVKGSWIGDRNGKGEITSNGFKTTVSAPKELDGPGIGANPEELLISAATNCYMITLAAILSSRSIEYSHLEVVSEGKVSKEGNQLVFQKITHRPTIYISTSDKEMLEKIEQLTHRAKKACFISQTLSDSVEVTVEPMIEIK